VGAQDYLTKPFTKDQLLHAVQQFAGPDMTDGSAAHAGRHPAAG
jgi:CheY-like chemotaxis protein